MKRLTDFLLALFGLIFISPILLIFFFLVWIEDYKSPLYIAPRVGINGNIFNMVKLRSMIVNADSSGVDSTSNSDSRITKVGKLIRKFKLDELTQLWNVLLGDMSLVGPRPNIKRETDLYTKEEKKLLSIKPGITDFASIVFSDEGEILKNKKDPDLAYHQLIRPGKSKLGLFYVDNSNFLLDMKIIYLTLITILSRKKALIKLEYLLKKLNAKEELQLIASRKKKLVASPPPGSKDIVISRKINEH